jgi:hypothetical protein
MNKNLSTLLGLTALLVGLPFLSKPAGADDLTSKSVALQLPTGYVLDQIQGKVLVLPRGASKPMEAQNDQTVQTGDEITTSAGSEASLAFNGSAMIQLSGESDLVVGELARPSAEGFISRLKLVAGQILAQVEKIGKSHSTFEIESGGVVCGVRGTAFEVQKEGPLVQTSTYEGVVEMDKEKLSQKVPAGEHSEFATDKNQFLLQRILNERERERYRNWQRYRELITQRQKEREEALKSFDGLPETEKGQLWQRLQQVRDIDRFRILRRMMREKNLHDRLQVVDKAVQAREDLLNKKEETEKKAQEQRELNLKTLKKREE